MVAFLFRGEGKWGVQRTLHQFSHQMVRSISAAEAAHMDLYFGRHAGCPALFTYLSQEPFFEFRAFSPLDGYPVFNDRVGVPSQGDASPGRYQGFLTFSRDDDL